ncbi:hypothetical protein Pcinc_027122 [Petrolisthes cinctipes]|uniref:Uncharacterized protein n=1 Tax=Petrolisthes cinctipes TaxID=88211 RepID=A0AAE1K9A5_PETCI|nr:hypothetical protein Pcinc_027122 [Petrolisthes cinctipes]
MWKREEVKERGGREGLGKESQRKRGDHDEEGGREGAGGGVRNRGGIDTRGRGRGYVCSDCGSVRGRGGRTDGDYVDDNSSGPCRFATALHPLVTGCSHHFIPILFSPSDPVLSPSALPSSLSPHPPPFLLPFPSPLHQPTFSHPSPLPPTYVPSPIPPISFLSRLPTFILLSSPLPPPNLLPSPSPPPPPYLPPPILSSPPLPFSFPHPSRSHIKRCSAVVAGGNLSEWLSGPANSVDKITRAQDCCLAYNARSLSLQPTNLPHSLIPLYSPRQLLHSCIHSSLLSPPR